MTRSKECFKCKTVQPLTEFYKHGAMADGHLNKCKTCTKSDVSFHRLLNLDKIRAYDRERGKLPHRKKLGQKIQTAWRNEDKRRLKCHNAVHRAIAKGTLFKSPCVRCGAIKSLAHHDDYDKPLEIMWLCQPCHKVRHKELEQGK